jgi:uncharacterized protein YjbI with pentapeptide repeats
VLKTSDSFSAASFEDCDFRKLTLTDKDFSYGSLIQTRLTDCRLTRCTFRGADLYSALLKRSVLTEVDFREAILEGVDFRGARFVRVDLRGATFNSRTLWPEGVDPIARGAVNMDTLTKLPW